MVFIVRVKNRFFGEQQIHWQLLAGVSFDLSCACTRKERQILFKTICLIYLLVVMSLCASSQFANADDLDTKSVLSIITEAGLLEPFYKITSIEHPPSGELILDGVIVGDGVWYEHVGGDGAGGAFITLADGTLIYLSSEGEAANLGKSVEKFLAISLSMYSWNSALRFVRGDLENDTKDWESYRQEWGMPAKPECEEEAIKILNLFDLKPSAEPFSELHLIVRASLKHTIARTQNFEFTDFAR